MAATHADSDVDEYHEEEYSDDDAFEDDTYFRTQAGSPIAGTVPGRTYTQDQVRKIERENRLLLTRLNDINRKGAQLDNTRRPQKHVAAASINRRKAQTRVHHDNIAMLKRLEGVKSTVPGSPARRTTRRAKPGPPKAKGGRRPKAKKLQQPEWRD